MTDEPVFFQPTSTDSWSNADEVENVAPIIPAGPDGKCSGHPATAIVLTDVEIVAQHSLPLARPTLVPFDGGHGLSRHTAHNTHPVYAVQ